MRLVIFGLTVSSSWGNGHATLWRSLIRALDRQGHQVVFYERDAASYAAHRDLPALPGSAKLRLYGTWDDIRAEARTAIDEADAAIVTSLCPDGRAACASVLDAKSGARVFYDLDTPLTLEKLDTGEEVPYLPREGLADFDLVLSFTGGRALGLLCDRLGARECAPLYGSVDPEHHRPVPTDPAWQAACSYLGTWSHDRQDMLEALFLAAARRRPAETFVLGGSKYPDHVEWPANVRRHDHVPPPVHSAFYCSSPVTLNVTGTPMARLGYCPSGRLFEAAACGVPVITDSWPGLDTFFTPEEEILIATTTDDALGALGLTADELARIGKRARERVLDEHSGEQRARELLSLIHGV